MNLEYLLLRLIRHFSPEWMIRFLLRHAWIIHPGLETQEPTIAVDRYCNILEQHDVFLANKRILVFGYGGHFGVGVELLRRGAEHVILSDKFALPDNTSNLKLLQKYKNYLLLREGYVFPKPEFISLFQADICDISSERKISPVDIVLSSSVFEHLPVTEMDSITKALISLTKPGGVHLHFIDLRDHFFKYPFEMLTFSERIWCKWLNPSSNLNRFRLSDYQRVFEKYSMDVQISILERDQVSFEKIKPKIRPEYLTGDDKLDNVTKIQVAALINR